MTMEGPAPSQQPVWPDTTHLEDVVAMLERQDPLTHPREADRLTAQLGKVATGDAFVLQAGQCAESFTDTPESAQDLFNVLLPMVVVLAYGGGLPVVKLPRAAGQYAKPRSSDTETRDGLTLPSYRGDIVNSFEFTESARQPNPDNMLKAYGHSRSILSTINELATGGFADLEKIHEWNVRFAATRTATEMREKYERVVNGISDAIRFMKACGLEVANIPNLHEAETFISHEALLLPYEMALTRPDSDGKLYDSSAHMLWIGERTRKLDEPHVAFCAAIENPIGVKLGPTATVHEILELCERLNPDRIPGRLTLITRMGVDKIDTVLPPLLAAVREKGHKVVWSCDPMHANTFTAPEGQKTRQYADIDGEIKKFFPICYSEDSVPGGVHLEITGEDVTECLGGSAPTQVTDLDRNYTSTCDPRLNPTQAIELAFSIAGLLKARPANN